MGIIINEKNLGRLEAAIKKAEGLARTRTMSVDELFVLVRQLDKALERFPKAVKKGAVAYISEAYGQFPAAYKGAPMKTAARVRYNGREWVLVEVFRDYASRSAMRIDDESAYRLAEWAATALYEGRWFS